MIPCLSLRSGTEHLCDPGAVAATSELCFAFRCNCCSLTPPGEPNLIDYSSLGPPLRLQSFDPGAYTGCTGRDSPLQVMLLLVEDTVVNRGALRYGGIVVEILETSFVDIASPRMTLGWIPISTSGMTKTNAKSEVTTTFVGSGNSASLDLFRGVPGVCKATVFELV